MGILSGGNIMRKFWAILPLVLLLQGCAAEETMETIADEWVQPVMAAPREVSVELPEEAAAPVMESDSEEVYLCEGYEIILERRSSGDLPATVRHVSGYEKKDLTVMETFLDGVSRYEFVWAAAGEQGDRLGRAVILDDGEYHYCLSVLRDADGTVDWDGVFRSFRLV